MMKKYTFFFFFVYYTVYNTPIKLILILPYKMIQYLSIYLYLDHDEQLYLINLTTRYEQTTPPGEIHLRRSHFASDGRKSRLRGCLLLLLLAVREITEIV
jgi:hypothetical protein